MPDFVDPDQEQVEEGKENEEEGLDQVTENDGEIKDNHNGEETNLKGIFDDMEVGKGIANALRFFGDRGMLGKDKYFEDGKAR